MTFKVKTLCDIAIALKRESKCAKHKVASVLSHGNKILSTGVNGTRAGEPNCCDVWCNHNLSHGAAREEHRKWSLEHEIHAEDNMFQRADIVGGATVTVTRVPCDRCTDLIIKHKVAHVIIVHNYNDTNYKVNDKLRESGICVSHWAESDYDTGYVLKAIVYEGKYLMANTWEYVWTDYENQNLPSDEFLDNRVMEILKVTAQ